MHIRTWANCMFQITTHGWSNDRVLRFESRTTRLLCVSTSGCAMNTDRSWSAGHADELFRSKSHTPLTAVEIAWIQVLLRI